jgi:predicted GIY-YIG superfamily endonuclease
MHAGGSLEHTAMAYREKTPAVYILASRRNGTIYTGVSSDLYVRIPQRNRA